eukprot:881807-Rhodomonas_salina.2
MGAKATCCIAVCSRVCARVCTCACACTCVHVSGVRTCCMAVCSPELFRATSAWYHHSSVQKHPVAPYPLSVQKIL